LEDVGHGGGKMAEVVVDMTGVKGMKNDARKERRASLQRRVHEVKLGMDIKEATK